METLQKAFDRIEWGTIGEKGQLYTLGKILVCPEIGTASLEYYEAITRGEKKKEPKRMNHWEIKASELVSAIICMMVFQNNQRIHFKRPFLFDFYHFMIDNKLYLYERLAYDEARLNRLRNHLKKLADKPVNKTYSIKTNIGNYEITKKILKENYPNFKEKHPYIEPIVKEFLSCGSYEQRDILIEMVKGLEIHFEKLRSE